jgi:hypothetical protein
VECQARCKALQDGTGLDPLGLPLSEFPYGWETKHGEELEKAGKLARELGMRLSMHPGRYIHPGSPRRDVAERSLAEPRYVARIFDLSLPAWESRRTRPEFHLSRQNPEKQAGAHTTPWNSLSGRRSWMPSKAGQPT